MGTLVASSSHCQFPGVLIIGVVDLLEERAQKVLNDSGSKRVLEAPCHESDDVFGLNRFSRIQETHYQVLLVLLAWRIDQFPDLVEDRYELV